jgi:peptide/nickel transport system ATP-binding protein
MVCATFLIRESDGAAADMSLLQIDQLNLSIGESSILKNISCAVDAGKVLGIIGESGSGKSMTAYAVMQLLPQGAKTTGAVRLDGANLLSMSEAQMCDIRGDDIGMIFQEPMTALNPVLTIGDQVAETVRVHTKSSRAEAQATAYRVLERVELPPDTYPMSRYPHELSGGQRQRVVIAMAIALRPRLLIADEPTTALDVTTQAQILKLLNKLVQEDDMALILISHDLAVVADVADDIIIMRDGVIVDSGTVEQVFTEQNHPYTRQLFRASTYQPERIAAESARDDLLVVEAVCRDYRLPRRGLFSAPGYFRAVDHVSFRLRRGENLGLVGESGCGKSTLTRAILGLDPCQEGSITLDGVPVVAGQAMPRSTRQKMQVVFQDPYASFNPRHRVGRLIAEPLHILDNRPTGAEKSVLVAEALQSVGLNSEDAERYIHQFSGGQRQRIAIARALITRPALIILDEAVSALDVSIRAQILDLLAELSRAHQLSYLFISHDLSVVRSVTDRVLVMKDGRIVEQGDTEEVFTHPTHPYTKSLIDAIPQLPVNDHGD